MLRAATVATLLAALAAAAPANARTHLPAVGATIWGPCPYAAMEDGCAYPDGRVYVTPGNGYNDPRGTYWHEQGHAFDYLRLTWPQRTRFRALTHSHGRAWFDTGNPDGKPEELFAEAYTGCADPQRAAWWTEGDDLRPTYHGGDSYKVTQRQYRRVCAWLARIAQ